MPYIYIYIHPNVRQGTIIPYSNKSEWYIYMRLLSIKCVYSSTLCLLHISEIHVYLRALELVTSWVVLQDTLRTCRSRRVHIKAVAGNSPIATERYWWAGCRAMTPWNLPCMCKMVPTCITSFPCAPAVGQKLVGEGNLAVFFQPTNEGLKLWENSEHLS